MSSGGSIRNRCPAVTRSGFADGGGRIRSVTMTVSLIPGTKKSVASLMDITVRKQAEERIKESERFLADVINFLPDATFVIDGDGKVIAWNRAIEEMTGIPAPEMIGKGNYEHAIPFYGERRPILIDLALKPDRRYEGTYVSTERGETVLIGEAYMPALKGGDVYLHGTASVLRESAGNVIGAIERSATSPRGGGWRRPCGAARKTWKSNRATSRR